MNKNIFTLVVLFVGLCTITCFVFFMVKKDERDIKDFVISTSKTPAMAKIQQRCGILDEDPMRPVVFDKIWACLNTKESLQGNSFWYQGDTLYWTIDGKSKPEYFLKFSMENYDVKKSNTIGHALLNVEPIKEIQAGLNRIIVNTEHYSWEVDNIDDVLERWSVKRIK